MDDLIEHIIKEVTFNDLRVKQRSIGQLFPSFGARVQAVAAHGGVEMKEQLPEWWHFEVASGTKPGVNYDVYVQFLNLEEMIRRYAGDRRLWNKEGTDVNYRLLAAEVLNHVDMRTSCSCPATLYWGQDFIRTARDAQFGKQEYRPPRIRNPHQYGAYCKHGQNVFDVLPAYTSTFASFLKKFWAGEVNDAVEITKSLYAGAKKGAEELGRRQAERPVAYTRGGKPITLPPEEEQPPEEELPPEGGVPVEPIGPQPATSPATRKPGPEPKPEDKGKKGKYKPNESVNEFSYPLSPNILSFLLDTLEQFPTLNDAVNTIVGKFGVSPEEAKKHILVAKEELGRMALVGEGIDKKRLGKCYVLSGRFVMDHPEYDLIHGTVTRRTDNYTIQHAWVEKIEESGKYKIRMVYDPVMNESLPWDAYERLMGAKEENRYTHEQMIHTLAKQKNWGPWE
jgi:hypothetical protein